MNRFYGILIFSTVFAFNCIGSEKQLVGRDEFIRSHRPFWFFTAAVEDGRVHLKFSKSHWYHYSSEEYDLGDVFKDIRIYRRKVDMKWSWDRAEVLDSLVCELSPDDIIFRGELEPKYGKSYDFYDDNAEQGNVYAYFVSASESPATGPVAVKIRNPEVWWSKERIAAELKSLEADFLEAVELEVAGKSCRGNDIAALTAGSGPKKKALLTLCG